MGSVPMLKARIYHAPTLASSSSQGSILLVNVQEKKKIKRAVTLKSVKAPIHQFIPPLFPLEPVLTTAHMGLLQASWKMIEGQTAAGNTGLGGNTRTCLVSFYDEFYKRLYHKDKKNIFRKYLPNLKAKGGLIQRMTKFICAMDISNLSGLKNSLKILGKQHTQRKIKPWMYSTLSETLAETVMLILGPTSNPDFYEAWTFALSFCLHEMIPQALKNQSPDCSQLQMQHALRLQHEPSDDSLKSTCSPPNSGRSFCK